MRFYLLFIAIVILASCKKEELPLPEEQLIPLIVDVQFAEAALKTLRPSKRDSMSVIYYAQLAEMHDMSVEKILDVLNQLNENPAQLSKVYEKVVEEINKLDAADATEQVDDSEDD